MSEATSIQIQPSTISRSSSSGILVSKSEWIDGIKGVVGGYDDLLSEIVDHLYGYFEDAVSSTHQTNAPSCFQTPMKGIMISGRPGTGKSVLASSLAEHSGLPYTVINCPDVFQTSKNSTPVSVHGQRRDTKNCEDMLLMTDPYFYRRGRE